MTGSDIGSLYGVCFVDQVHQTLDDEEQECRRRATRDSLARRLAYYIMEQKPHATRVSHEDPCEERHMLELYVLTPAEFHLAVRQEAKRYMALTQRYPQFVVPGRY